MLKNRSSNQTRYHSAARGAAALFAVLFVLPNLPAGPVMAPDTLGLGQYGPEFECDCQYLARGWPFVFLEHDLSGLWMGADVAYWQFGPVRRFRPTALVLNIAALLIGVLVVAHLVDWYIGTYGWRFGIAQLLATMLCIAAGTAWLLHRYRVHQAQVAHLQQAGWLDTSSADWIPFGPLWLRTITGRQYWQWGDMLMTATVCNADDIPDLPGKRAIQVLEINCIYCDRMPSLADFPNLRAINLRTAALVGSDDTDPDPPVWRALRVIARCRTLEGLNLYDQGMDDRSLQELAQLPNLTHLDLTDSTRVSDRGLVPLATIKSLRVLGLFGTSVTSEGVEKLQAALPKCEIHWEGDPP